MHKKVFALLSGIFLIGFPVSCLAGQANYFSTIIDRLLDIVVWPVFLGLVVIMFIWAGVLFLIAQGDPTKISQARKAVIWATVGVGVGFIAWSAEGLIRGLLGA